MTLTAESISASVLPGLSAVPRSGKVHSVFSRAVNILCDEVTWLSLHPRGTPMHPYAATVAVRHDAERGLRGRRDVSRQARETGCSPGDCHSDLEEAGFLYAAAGASFAAGDPITLCRSHIWFERQAVTIDLRHADPWDPSLSPLPNAGGIDCARLLGTLEHLIGTGPVTSPFLAAVSGRPLAATDTWSHALLKEAAGVVDRFEAGLRASSRQAVADGVRRAVGLGSGFTPSGDDYLTGLAGAYWYFAPGDPMREALPEGILPLMHRTSLPSFFMLKGAVNGQFSEPLMGLLRALGQASEAGVAPAFRRLTGTGAASGEDMLAGLLTYLKVETGVGWAHAAN
jgi:hypothetical protein